MTRPISRREIHEGWTVRPLAGPVPPVVHAAGGIPAAVPGVVHTDLLAAGLIADPYLGTNEKAQEWIGSTAWEYRTSFVAAPGADRYDLVFHGLDTVATVELNGRIVLESRNQHRSYRVPVGDRLREGGNDLVVRFAAPVPEADRASLELGYRPHVNHHPYNAIRKMACSFGWDWGPDTATSGIWRPVTLETWSVARIARLEVVPTVDGTEGSVRLRITVERAADAPLEITAEIDGRVVRTPVDGDTVELRLTVADVRRWWPRGYGQPARYDLAVRLESAGDLLDTASRRIGFRSVRADTAPDADGTPFTLVVNDRPVFVKGANWIPDDAFPSRIGRDRYAERLGQAADAGMNLLRVWGGGIFESEDFYDLADELGLLVWQDFLLACAAYSEDEPLASEIEAEAREAVVRLGTHPSLIVLNGNNENLWGHDEWGWQPRLEGRSWGARYYFQMLPAVTAELAPHVVYTPGSPFSPGDSHRPNDPEHGTMHIWDLWNQRDFPHYRDYRPRFVAEFGWQGPPAWSTLTESLTDDPLTPESPGMLVHQKALEGNVKLTDGLVAHLPLPNSMPEWHWAMSLNQAVAIRTAVEWFRSLQPHCMGTIVWQLNDCWPVVSWAAVDGAGRRKPLWYALRDAYADRLLTVQPARDGLTVHIVNDSDEALLGALRVERRAYDGTELTVQLIDVDVEPRSTLAVPVAHEVSTPGSPRGEVVRATLDGLVAHWFFAEPRDSALSAPRLIVHTATEADGVLVRIRAEALVRDLALLVDVVDPAAEVDRMLVTLLPGEEAEFRIRATSALDPAAFRDARVLRSANELVAGAGTITDQASMR